MKDIKQFKLTNDDEIICEVIQYDVPDNSAMVVRGAMKIILIADHKRGIRFYAFRPWMGFTDDPTILQTLNAAHIIGEVFPSEEIVEHYSGTVKKIKKALIKKDMALDEIHEKTENMSEEEFEEFIGQYIDKEDLFDPDDFKLDSSQPSNVIRFKPKGTLH